MTPRVALFEATDQARPSARASVLPVLEALHDVGRIDLVRHERFGTLAQLATALGGWRPGGPAISYVHAVGRAGGLSVDRTRISLSDLAQECKGRLGGQVVYCAWAPVLAGRGAKAKEFVDRTGAAGVYGFGGPVDWLQGTGFDMLFLETVDRVGYGSRLQQDLTWRYPDVVKRLGFDGTAGKMPSVLGLNPLRWLPNLPG